MSSARRIDPGNPACSDIAVMIAHMSAMSSVPMPIHRHVKIHHNKVPRVPKIPPPERIGDPSIHVCIIRRRSIVGDNRRALIIVIVINDGRFGIIRPRYGAALLDRRTGSD